MKNKITKTDTKTETDIWEKIKKRAKEIQKSYELLGKVSDNEKEKIFKERAYKLSQTEKKSDDDKDLIKIISFNIESELYGIDIKYLHEVYEVDKITHIPCTPSFIYGLINLRGNILTVLNLSSLFNLSSAPHINYVRDKILILESNGIKAGIRVDSFGSIYELSRFSIQPVSPIFFEGNKIIKHEFPINPVRSSPVGIGNLPPSEEASNEVNKTSLLIIDVEEFLNNERFVVSEDV